MLLSSSGWWAEAGWCRAPGWLAVKGKLLEALLGALCWLLTFVTQQAVLTRHSMPVTGAEFWNRVLSKFIHRAAKSMEMDRV